MLITEVATTVTDLDEAEGFWRHVLRLPVDRVDGALHVSVGTTSLTLELRPDGPVADHLALAIPADAFDAARRWLTERCDLLDRDGQDEFDGPPGWDSRSLYFVGPSGAVLELIARRRLPDRAGSAPFGPEYLLGISEVGIAVPDVPAAVRTLAETAGLTPFAGTEGPDFAAVGDDHGLLILAEEGRPWLPTRDRRAVAAPSTIRVDRDEPGVSAVTVRLGAATVVA
ncbi:VOC family protein [Tersicoccus sp. Bi-70]|uniref:VOC family protein n=1 Tax=Tersicoccus sp. Bi-70 TaxID=1897634 RepID=UPI00097678F2|nr:hypothetical protein [Tersicoccus sp. Bi-70]OMH34224.1 hypothetical protein BGP79_03585 [Tersicoccus sp. Bi-70]